MALAEARQKAKKAGVPMADLRGLTTEAEIQAVIDRHTGKARPVAKKKTATVAKKSTTRTTTRKAPARKTTAAKTTRTAAKSTRTATKTNSRTTAKSKTTARKTTTAKTTKRAASNSSNNGGRNLLEDIDWTETEGWNPREGSAPDLILRALRKFRGNREKVFDALVSDLWTFVKKTDSNGRKRSKAEAEWQLRYRISRTAWDFAKRTGQHEPSANRATYGEGGTGIGVSGGMPVQFRPDDFDGKPVFKRAKKTTAKAATKTTAKTTTRKAAGRPRTAAKTTAKAKATTTAKARTTAAKRSTGTTRRARPTVRRK